MANQNQNAFFSELYDTTREKVLAYIVVKCSNTEDIADIFQETYTEIVSIIRKRGVTYLKNPEAVVMKIARQKVYRHYKLLERLHGVEKVGDFEDGDPKDEEFDDFSLEESLFTKWTVDMAVDYVSKKDELTKKIFYLYYYMDKPIKEIAELFSIKESNVKNRLYRTLKELREYFSEKGMV